MDGRSTFLDLYHRKPCAFFFVIFIGDTVFSNIGPFSSLFIELHARIRGEIGCLRLHVDASFPRVLQPKKKEFKKYRRLQDRQLRRVTVRFILTERCLPGCCRNLHTLRAPLKSHPHEKLVDQHHCRLDIQRALYFKALWGPVSSFSCSLEFCASATKGKKKRRMQLTESYLSLFLPSF